MFILTCCLKIHWLTHEPHTSSNYIWNLKEQVNLCQNVLLDILHELLSLIWKFSWILWPLLQIKNPSLVSEYYGCISLRKFKIGFLNSKRITVHQRNHRLLAQSGLFGSLMHSDLSRLGYICLVEKSSQFF